MNSASHVPVGVWSAVVPPPPPVVPAGHGHWGQGRKRGTDGAEDWASPQPYPPGTLRDAQHGRPGVAAKMVHCPRAAGSLCGWPISHGGGGLRTPPYLEGGGGGFWGGVGWHTLALCILNCCSVLFNCFDVYKG